LFFFNTGLAFAEEARILFYIRSARDVCSFDLALLLSFRKRYIEPFLLKSKAVRAGSKIGCFVTGSCGFYKLLDRQSLSPQKLKFWNSLVLSKLKLRKSLC
jgi:hypothetical protein